jgi:peptidoglycan/xylan/chitin deacetylase (PgdA/CDA1 family)
MHPKENTVIALPQILSALQKDGFSFVTLEKLITLELSGILPHELIKGVVQ